MQRRVASELRLKRTPTLDFIYDDTTDRAMRLEALLDEQGVGADQLGAAMAAGSSTRAEQGQQAWEGGVDEAAGRRGRAGGGRR